MDKNAIIKALRDYVQATSNEVANTVAAPVDLINAGLGRVGLGSEEPVGGSAWMRRQGLTAPVPEGMAQTLGETTGLVLPMVGAMKAKEIATALRGMGENIAKPKGGGMAGGQRGAIDLGAPQGPQAEALKLAQQRAALPISKGGLGLPANNTAAERAAAMGFTDDVYHGGNPNVQKFMPKANQEGSEQFLQKYRDKLAKNEPVGYMDFRDGTFMSPNAEIASSYARDYGAVYPLVKKSSMPLNLDISGMRPQVIGAKPTGTIDEMNLYRNGNLDEISIIDPDQIRSRFAAFDPFRKTAAIAAAMGVAAPDLLAKEKQPTPPQNLVKALRNGN